jgi:hypothetical protein
MISTAFKQRRSLCLSVAVVALAGFYASSASADNGGHGSARGAVVVPVR